MADESIMQQTEDTAPDLDDSNVAIARTGLNRRTNLRDLICASFGEIYVYDNSGGSAQSISTSWAKITQFDTDGQEAGDCDADHTNDRITATKTGIYQIALTLSISGTAAATFTVAIYVNGTTRQENLRFEKKLNASGEVDVCSLSGFCSLTANDYIEVFAIADGASKNFLVEEGNLSIKQISY